MQQLGGLDTFFLNIESNACPMHVGGVVILEPDQKPAEDGGFGRVLRHIESRLDYIPQLRRRLLSAPLELDLPYWIEDPDFDLVHHVKHRALPSPGDDRRLADLVCELASTRLDRSLPLWEIHYVEGLKGGRVAAITKMHHAAIDGISGAEIMGKLLDVQQTPRALPPVPPWVPDVVPSSLDLSWRTVRSLIRRPGDAAEVVRKTLPVLMSAGRDLWAQRRPRPGGSAPSESSSPLGLAGEAPRTRFNRQISARRSYAFGSLPLDKLKAVKNALGTTLNDVILGVCAEALRRYLIEKNELPALPLVAGVPMSTRSDAPRGPGDKAAGNQVIFLRASLHTDEVDPVLRLQKISRELAVVKERTRALPATLMGDWAQLPAPALMAQAARLYENFDIQDYLSPTFNVVISNVPGPSVPLYFAGMRVQANHPVSIPYHGLGFNITLMSYRGQIDYGLTADRDAMPDIERFGELLQASLRLLCERTAPPTP